MPLLHSLCASTSLANNLPSTVQLANLTTKPSSLSTSLKHLNATNEFPLPLPELPTHVKEKILSLEIMGVDYGRALVLNPDLRTASLDSIHSIITYLLSKGIYHKDLPKIFGMCPKVLTSNIRNDISPVFSFLSKDLKVPDSNFRKVINKCPRLLASSVRDQLKPTLFYLQRLGFKDTDALAYQDSILLVSSVERTLMPKLQYLIGLGLLRQDAVQMVLRCPGLFTYSIEKNFRPKYEYFANEMYRSLEELKEFPQYFSFSLDKRIKPRHQHLMKKGLCLHLSVMLKSTDEEFKQLIEKS